MNDDENILLADGFGDAFIGLAHRLNNTFAIYDYNKCIEILMEMDMDIDEAKDYFEYNVVGAWVGNQTPAFLEDE